MKNRLKPMGVRDILDSTFTIMRENFWSFQGVCFKSIILPVFLVLFVGIAITAVFIVIVGARTNIPITDPLFWSQISRGSIAVIILGIILLFLFIVALIVTLVIGGIYYTYGNFKIFKNGLHDLKTSSKEAFQGLKGNRGRIFLVQFVIGLLLYIIAVPGILISVIFNLIDPSSLTGAIVSYVNSFLQLLVGFFFYMALPVVIFENFDVMKSIKRGFKLMSNHRWRIFWTLLLVYLLAYILFIVAMGVIAIPIMLAVLLKNIIPYIAAGAFCIGGLFVFIELIAYSFGPLTAIYYDLIIRKEGYDISVQLAGDNKTEVFTQPL